MLNEGEVEIRVRGGIDCTTGNGCSGLSTTPDGPVSLIAADDNRVAYVETETPMSIHVQTTSGIQQHIIVEVSAVIDEERDEHKLEADLYAIGAKTILKEELSLIIPQELGERTLEKNSKKL